MISAFGFNNSSLENLLNDTFKLATGGGGGGINIIDTITFFHKEGTHYYTYYDHIPHQQPFSNLFIVGEMISNNQGWVEGALESVDNIIDFL